jgi:hypothetical protein
MSVYCADHMVHTNTLCGQNAERSNAKAGGTGARITRSGVDGLGARFRFPAEARDLAVSTVSDWLWSSPSLLCRGYSG